MPQSDARALRNEFPNIVDLVWTKEPEAVLGDRPCVHPYEAGAIGDRICWTEDEEEDGEEEDASLSNSWPDMRHRNALLIEILREIVLAPKGPAWAVITDDDTYLRVVPLRRVLQRLDPERPLYVGHAVSLSRRVRKGANKTSAPSQICQRE